MHNKYRKSKVYALNDNVLIFTKDKYIEAMIFPEGGANAILKQVKGSSGKYSRVSPCNFGRVSLNYIHYNGISLVQKKALVAITMEEIERLQGKEFLNAEADFAEMLDLRRGVIGSQDA